MKKNFLLLSLTASLGVELNADMLGLEVGGAYWATQTSGNVKYKGDSIDIQKDLGYKDFNTNFFWATLEHPIPFIPNLKIQHTSFDNDASKVANVTFDNKTYTGTIKSNLTLNQTDFIAYYELLDNWISLDLGINGKYIDAQVSMNSFGQTASSKDLNYVIPMAYGKVKFQLPFSGLSVESDVSYIGYNSNKFYDLKGGVSYETKFGLGATAGYRYEKLELDNLSDVYSNLEISGAYVGLFYHF